MQHILRIPLIPFIIIASIIFLTSCEEVPTIPTVSTTDVSDITRTTATSGGNVTDDGNAEVTARGICWSTTEDPTTADNKTSDGAGTGSFVSSLTELSPGTEYYVRAYATNSEGTAYGNQVSFTTGAIQLATLTTDDASSITQTTAVSGGNITDDGGADITARGVCWGLSQSPTLSDSYTDDGSGTGAFTSNITGLNTGTTYYVIAYATNEAGTAYGNEVSFTTEPLTDADGNVYKTVIIGDQLWMAENLKTTKYNDGTDIPLVINGWKWASLTSPGFCWYDNDRETYGDTYGALYNWFAVNTDILCPDGWHVPGNEEWDILTGYLGGAEIAGGKLKETGTANWKSPNTDATNESGFTGRPGGFRSRSWDVKCYGKFGFLGMYGFWWSQSDYDADCAWIRELGYESGRVGGNYVDKGKGLSVRCIKD